MIKAANDFHLTIIGECSTNEHYVYLKKVKLELSEELKIKMTAC